MNILTEGIDKGLITFISDQEDIAYNYSNKKYNYVNPEEQIRAEAYLQLIINYGYNPDRIGLEVEVPRRTPSDRADVVVFRDDAKKYPYIVVECKKQDISDAEFLQAIEQGFGNANSLRACYLWVTSGRLNEYYNVADFPPQEREENKIADLLHAGQSQANKAKYYKGGRNEFGGEAFDIKSVPEYELEKVFQQAHDTLWSGGKRNPAEAFDELDKLIFCKIWDEKTFRLPGVPYNFQVFTNQPADELLKRIKAIYEKGREKDPEVFKEDIRLTAKELERVVGYLAPINLSETDLDSKGRAFETFLDSFFRGEFGQYFTPRAIVEFITEVLPISNESLVLDPACGSGGFLLYILDKIRRQADQMAEDGYFAKDSRQHYNYWHDFAENNLYGIEISEGIARTAKMNMIIHDDGHTNVIAHDGLENLEKIRAFAQQNNSKGYRNFDANIYDAIATNPPFGSNVKYNEHRYLEDYELGKKDYDWLMTYLRNVNLDAPKDTQKSEILFIEQCHQFLKPGGFLAMVIPDGILTNSSLQYVRDWLEEHFRIVAVVSLPQTAFTAKGAGVKSSVIFLQKYDDKTTAAIQRTKVELQATLFEKDEYGKQIVALEAEKKRVIKKGDATIQELEDALINHLKALRDQGSLDGNSQREIEKATKDKITAYQKTDEFKAWKKNVTDEYNEKINAVKEALEEEFIKQVRQQLQSYPIFMAIAEDIGYDATGRETGKNELHDIAKELKEFIEAVKTGTDRFFV